MNSQSTAQFNLETNEFVLFSVNLSVNESSISLAICIINSYTKEILLSHIIDNNFLTNLENILKQNVPAHEDTNYYLLGNTPLKVYEDKIDDIAKHLTSFDQIIIHQNHKIFNEKVVDLWSGIKVLLEESVYETSQITFRTEEFVLPLETLYHTLIYTKMMQFDSFYNQFSIKKLSNSSFMSFDLSTVNCLNIFDNFEERRMFLKSSSIQKLAKNTFNSTYSKSKTSVFSVLNLCQTKFGSRTLRVWLMQPLQLREDIQRRLDLVQALISQVSFNIEIRDKYLGRIDDLQSISIKISRYINRTKASNGIKLVDCAKLQRCISVSKELYGYIQNYEGMNKELFNQRFVLSLEKVLVSLSKLEEMLSKTIIFDNETKEYMLEPSLDPKLTEIKIKMDNNWNEIKRLKDDIENDIYNLDNKSAKKGKKIKITEYINAGYVFELPKADGDDFIRNNPEFKLITTNKRTVMISNSKLSRLSFEIKAYRTEYHQYEIETLKSVYDVVISYYPVINNIISILSEMDILSSFALMVSNSKETYSKPIISLGRNLILKDSRHLILEWNSSLLKNSSNVVANNCNLDDITNIKVITGINMGGKSTYLRQVGICVLLAHIGCYIPASYAEIPIIDKLFTRVGAGDLMLKGISTYMNEMIEVCSLIKSATRNSLMLIDELGRGTSTDDGIGISWAILYHISKEINSYCLFATHFYELTELEKVLKNVKNYYMSYSMLDGELMLEYKVVPGKNNKSFGVGMFHSMKFDDLTCETLNRFIKEDEDMKEQENNRMELN